MHATYRAKVTAVSFGKGVFTGPDGNQIEYDNTKVHVELVLRGANARGVVTQEYKIGKSAAYHQFGFGQIALPFMAELDIEKTSNGKGDAGETVVEFRILKNEQLKAA